MLKIIAENSADPLDFIERLDTPLSEPQKCHVLQIADTLITTESRKDLSNLYRYIVGNPYPKSAADTFREASLRAFLVRITFELAEAEGAPKQVFLSINDSLTAKDKHSQPSSRPAAFRGEFWRKPSSFEKCTDSAPSKSGICHIQTHNFGINLPTEKLDISALLAPKMQ